MRHIQLHHWAHWASSSVLSSVFWKWKRYDQPQEALRKTSPTPAYSSESDPQRIPGERHWILDTVGCVVEKSRHQRSPSKKTQQENRKTFKLKKYISSHFISPLLRCNIYLKWKSVSLCPTLQPQQTAACHEAPPSNGIFQARILEWVAIPSSWGSSQPWGQTHVSCVSCIAVNSSPS